jgi:putative DNA primase/helicase
MSVSDNITLTTTGTVVGGGNYMDSVPITKAHWHELTVASAISPDVIAERGYVSIDRPRSSDSDSIPTLPHLGAVGDRRAQLKAMGFPTWVTREDSYFPMLWLPKWSPRGVRNPGQMKPWRPVNNREGKAMKYASARGATGLDVHPRWTRDRGHIDPTLVPAIQDPAIPLWITEGVKKGDALTTQNVCAVALDGVYNWRNSHATLGDWEDVKLRGREVSICFDADTTTKPAVQQAMIRLGRWLKYKGVAKVWYLVVPASVNGVQVKGVDDYLAAGGTVTELERARTDKPPRAQSDEDRFTDSALAEQVVMEALSGRYVSVINIGWYAYDGRRWSPCSDDAVLEAVREFARDMYRWALQEERERIEAGKQSDPFEADGWRKVQSASRLRAVLSLAKGNTEIIRDLDQFDTWPDLINTPSGVRDLVSGALSPHDPALMLTKITAVDYVPGAVSGAFAQALEAMPKEIHDWMQVRLGQAMSGYEPDDDRLILLTGGGENGKTTLMQALFRALGGEMKGGYAARIPNTLLLRERNKGAATPEKMTLQGVRFGYMEETPEGRHLDTTVVKEVIGSGMVDGRKLFKDFVTFSAGHSLFLNTNHVPIVSETDHGTWRRLLRVEFPYTFVKRPEQVLDPATHRLGAPGLKDRLSEPDAQRAALAWMVEGAMRWYASGRSLRDMDVPDPVAAATRVWRRTSDVILGWLDEMIEFDPAAWVPSLDLYKAYEQWITARGHRPMAETSFAGKLAEHTEIPSYVVKKQTKRETEGISRLPVHFGSPMVLPDRPMAWRGLRFR